MKGMLAVVLSHAIATPASAGFMDGNDLYEVCKEAKRWEDGVDVKYGPQKSARCLGYIIGVADTFLLSGNRIDQCDTDNTKAGQIEDVAFKYLVEHPDQRQRSASLLVSLAINAAFCEN